MKKTSKKKSFTLFSYTIPVDDGAAPNPYWGKMTLAICKPVIRRTAKVGDWIVGTGSKKSPIGNIQNSVVYAMKVSKVLTMDQYNRYCNRYLPNKIPNIKHKDIRRHIGDSVYDFRSEGVIKLRPSVHTLENKKTDLGGENVLLSDHFYYFGDHPLYLPKEFQTMIKPNQGHRSTSNQEIADKFIAWLEGINMKKNTLLGNPQIIIDFNKRKSNDKQIDCAGIRCKVHKSDEKKILSESRMR